MVDILILAQTGSAPDHIENQACSPYVNITAGQRPSKELVEGGASGVAVNCGVQGSQTKNNSWMETSANVPGVTTWNSGDWVVRLNVTTAQANTTWEAVSVCRVTSGGTSQETVAFTSSTPQSTTSTGIKTMTVTQAADVTADATDRIYIVPTFKKTTGGNVNLQIQYDQDIDTPIDRDNQGGVAANSIMFGMAF